MLHCPFQRGCDETAEITQYRFEVRRMRAAPRPLAFDPFDATSQECPHNDIRRLLENLQRAPALVGPCFDLVQNFDESRRSVFLEVCHQNGNARGRQSQRSDDDKPPPATRAGRNSPTYV